ncbi:MAG: hypothetical protein ACOYJO_00485 [Eubacterium sp.]|jgi:HlyD family secretion protein
MSIDRGSNKGNKKKMSGGAKAVLISVIVVAAVACSVVTAKAIKKARTVVEVTPVSYLNTGYYEDQQTCDATVYDSDSQAVYTESTQIVKEVYVIQGQNVKAGDRLLAYDLTSQELTYQMKELEVQRDEYDLNQLQNELYELENTTPVPEPTPKTDTDEPGEPDEPEDPGEKEKITDAWNYLDGDSIDDYLPADPALTEPHGSVANPYVYIVTADGKVYGSFLNKLAVQPDVYAEIRICEGNSKDGRLIQSWMIWSGSLGSYDDTDSWTVKEHGSASSDDSAGSTAGTGSASGSGSGAGSDSSSGSGSAAGSGSDFGSDPETVTYTPRELAEAIAQKKQEIRDADLTLRRAELELSIMAESLSDGVVYAKKDGVVSVVSDPADPPQDGTPFLRVDSGSGALVNGSVSELLLSNIKVGQQITAQDWTTGETYTGTITAINDYPSDDTSYYGGNQNVSYYGFTASIDDAPDLETGTYLQLYFDTSGVDSSSVIVIDSAYVRKDNGGKYVMKDADGVLAKQYIKVDKTVYGSMVLISDGITEEDMLAFPYGDGATEGVKTKQAEEDDLSW